MSVGALLIGLGQIGVGYDVGTNPDEHIHTHARALSRRPEFRLIGGVDPDETRRQRFEREYGGPAFPDLESALQAVRPDLVVIAVPTPLHGATLHQVLHRSRPQAILCEKPLSNELAEARSMVLACEQQGVRLFVNYVRRSDPGVIEVKRRLVTRQIADPIKGVVWYSKGLLHSGSHFLNLLTYWLGDVVDAQVIDRGRLWNGLDPEPDVRVCFESGTAVFLSAREEAYCHHTVELVAANGRLRYERGGEQIHWRPVAAAPSIEGDTVLAPAIECIASGMARYQWHVAEQLSAAIDGRDCCLCSGADALATLESLQTIIDQR